MKYGQGYKYHTQEKPPRYPLEPNVAEGDQVDSVPLVSGVPPTPATLEMLAESSQDLPVSGATVIPPVEPGSKAIEEPPAADDTMIDLVGPSSKAIEKSRPDASNV